MTVVAAIARAGRVVMAADWQTGYGGIQAVFGARKVRRLAVGHDQALVAASGNGALLGVLQRHLTVDAPDAAASLDELQRWADVVASGATEVYAGTEPSLLRGADSDSAASMDGALLLGYRGHLFYLFTHQAVHVPDGIATLGSGSELALGAVHTALGCQVRPIEAVRNAVMLASRFCEGCGLDSRDPLFETLGEAADATG